jgi:hypothetical protein
MKKILILIFLFSLFNVHSQNNDFKKFHIGVLFSPEYSYRTEASNNTETQIKNKPIFGFQVGILFDYRIKNWIAIETGFKLAKRGFLNEFEVVDITGAKIGTLNNTFQNFYIELPVKTNFYFLNRTIIEMFASAAITPGYLLQGKTITEWDVSSTSFNNSQQKNENIQNWNLSASFGIGIDISPIPNLGIRLEPFFQHSLIPEYTIPTYNGYGFTDNKYYHWSTGIRFAIFYAF